MGINRTVITTMVGIWLSLFPLVANGTELPSFLPEFYGSAFEDSGRALILANHVTKEGSEQYLYRNEGNTLFLSVVNIKSDAAQVNAVMGNILQLLNKEMGAEGGEFLRVTNREIYAAAGKDVKRTIFVYALPSAVQVWSYSGVGAEVMNFDLKFEMLRNLANRQRYREAVAEGNVAMGTWGPQIHELAMELLNSGRKKEGLGILEKVLATSPNNFRAHMDFIKYTSDTKAAANSARIIVKNAEDRELVESARSFLKKKLYRLASVPFLEKGGKGLQVILVPLEPCDLSLLDDVATTYEKITGVPVKIRRLKEPFQLRPPDRFPYQRVIQEAIINLSGDNTVFTNWSKDKYLSELKRAAAPKDPWTRYSVKEFSEKASVEEGQYLADPYLDWFLKVLERYNSDDVRTMYVGITSANIYSGDNNFLFSLHMANDYSRASILSYYMMLAKNSSQSHESRQRLVERIAKELVPASLKSLQIPRSTDPGCPYSYSDGVARLDEKTLQLSDATKTALAGLRKTAPGR